MTKDQSVRLKRLTIYGIIGVLYSLYLGYDYFTNESYIWELIIAIGLLLSSIVFLLAPIFIKKKKKTK